VLHDLPQGQWQEAAVDMRAARRPDGSGGALAADERIDDIQFYVEPEAELLIDDIVLYDAVESATAPFPKRFFFTGWFDTGRQGTEWPGDFEIVPHEPPLKWKAAQAVETPDKEARWIRVDLRGSRPLGRQLTLRFRYRLSGTDSIELEMGWRSEERSAMSMKLESLRRDEWTETTVNCSSRLQTAPAAIDQLVFRIPREARLQVDDLLLYEPAEREP
jgi:hypothetical protein